MIEKLPYTKPIGAERDLEVLLTAGDAANIVDKLNELIEAYNEHTHEYWGHEPLINDVTSKPLPPQSSKQVKESE